MKRNMLVAITILGLAVTSVVVIHSMASTDTRAMFSVEIMESPPENVTPIDISETSIQDVDRIRTAIADARANGTGGGSVQGRDLRAVERVLEGLPDSSKGPTPFYYVRDGDVLLRIMMLYET